MDSRVREIAYSICILGFGLLPYNSVYKKPEKNPYTAMLTAEDLDPADDRVYFLIW